jgi:polyisoprenoid-binding protein YceI
MTMRSTIFAAAFSIAAFGLAGAAAAEEWAIDKGHTHVLFEVSHLGFSTTHGGFREVSGTVNLDEESPENTKVDVTIDAASVFSWLDRRDAHLRNEDFFNVEKFPVLTFKSTRVERAGEKTAKMTGDLTMLGVTKAVTLDVKLNNMGPHPFRSERKVAGFSATGSLKRSDFGMNYGLPGIGDEVKIRVEIEINRQAQ